MNLSDYTMIKDLEEIALKKLLLDVKVETQVTLQLLVEKGIVTREEVAEMRKKVKLQKSYQDCYKMLEEEERIAKIYNDNPEQILMDIFTMG